MKIIAHRGASGEFPENSLLAFEQAITQRADGIELDVRFHDESGQFIVLHDAYVDKITNGQGHYQQFSLSELTQLSLGKNQKVITLEQAINLINDRLLINIEVKCATDDKAKIKIQLLALNKLLQGAQQKYQCSNKQFIISSFNHQLIYQSQALMPKVQTSALIAHTPITNDLFAQQLSCFSINVDIDCLNKTLVDDIHQSGYEVWVYTVDKAEEIALCRQLNVDAIFTNFPAKTRHLMMTCKDN